MKFLTQLVCLTLLFLFCRTAVAAEPALPKIAIQPFGSVQPDLIARTKQSIEQCYSVEVTILPAVELPASAYYRPRDRYRAEKLLRWLDGNTDVLYTKVVGITTSDISTTKGEIFDWGIFGQGLLGGRPCVVSSFRLRKNVNHTKLLERVGKVVTHEVGHTFGLDHCPNNGCTMNDACGKIAVVDAESGQLCQSCRQKVPARGSTGVVGGSSNAPK